ncbi:hypothetical protein CAPTEDRAFT_204668 [Capitella teleta]|uniref:Uncharacterized protein n=1 Tax=Capitella teleta TaxID=283909 RepID=R7T7Z2_CAPTE|nr:hypothetical protein CAPTEDRAFT_204668 [Capitella teleta]|eukprot:ELT87545.1 hypothetical protein CAPTEDRAFT_204668 [Capitella teleta]
MTVVAQDPQSERPAQHATKQPQRDETPDAKKETWTEVVNRRQLKRDHKATTKRVIRAAAKDLRVVVGNGSDESVKSCPPIQHIFVYEIARDCEPESIGALMKNKGVSPIDIRKTSKSSWPSSSFRVSIAKEHFNQVFSEGFWPQGVRCREWIARISKGQPPTAEVADTDQEHEEELLHGKQNSTENDG